MMSKVTPSIEINNIGDEEIKEAQCESHSNSADEYAAHGPPNLKHSGDSSP